MFLRNVVNFVANKLMIRREEEKTFEDLSCEVVLMIFSFLDAESLKNASLVCTKWNELIGSSASTMNKLKLKLDPWTIEKLEESAVFNRHYNFVDIFYGNVFDKVVDALNRFKVVQARKFKIFGPQTVGVKVIELLSKMPMLEILVFETFKIDIRGEETLEVNLPELRSLEIDSVNCGALKFITAEKISRIYIHGYRIPSFEDTKNLKDFLSRSKQLKKLDLNYHSFAALFGHQNLPNFSFQLSEFKLDLYQTSLSPEMGKNFNKFLKSQSNLESLVFNLVENIPQSIFITIFNELKNLTLLDIQVADLPIERSFYEKINQNLSLRELKLRKFFPNVVATRGYLGNFPLIESLWVNRELTWEELTCLNDFNKNLKTLTAHQIQGPPVKSCKFNNLKTLSVDFVIDTAPWMALIASSLSIETIELDSIEKGEIDRAELIEFLTNQPTLRHLKLSGDYDEIKIIFDKIKFNYGNLKTLELKMSITNDYGSTESAAVKFEFPENLKDWSVEEQEAKFDEAWENRGW